MGLDLYAGSLTRYYAHAWKTVVQQLGEAEGFTVEVRRPAEPDAVEDPAQIAAAVIAWRDGLSEALKAHLTAPLDWPEDLASPYFTDKPAWDGYAALVLWAAHEEHPDHSLPAVAPDDWSSHPAYQLAYDAGSASRYAQLVGGTELWLPADFAFVFSAEDPTGRKIGMGSAHRLVDQLDELNRRTWKASTADLAEWRKAGADFGAPIEASARFAFSVFRYCAESAVLHRLVVKLDY